MDAAIEAYLASCSAVRDAILIWRSQNVEPVLDSFVI